MMSKVKIVLTAAGIFVGLIVLVMLLAGGSWLWRYYTAEVRGVVDAEEQIESAPSRIARYEEFFDLCSNVQTLERSLAAQERRLAAYEGDASGKDRIMATIAGIEAQRANAINRYNNTASQAYTSGRFQASNLPPRLSHNTENTTCEFTQ